MLFSIGIPKIAFQGCDNKEGSQNRCFHFFVKGASVKNEKTFGVIKTPKVLQFLNLVSYVLSLIS